jgi:hypothetical protein
MRKKKIFLLFLFAFAFAPFFCAHALELVPCKDNCNLCDIIVGMKRIFDYLGLIIVAAATLFIIIAGMLYMFSSGSKNLMELAKKAFITCLTGFLLYHFSWLVVDAILKATGYNKVTSWWQFDCPGSADNADNGSKSASKEEKKKTEAKCDSKNKKLDSIKIQCDEKDFKLEGDGTGFYIILDTLSEDKKGQTKQLKAIAKYTCDSETIEEDVTAQAEWKASDETQIKVAKGLVAAVTTSLGSSSESVPYVEAKYQEKISNQAKVYINLCPNTTANIEKKDTLSLKFDNLFIPKVHAETSSDSLNSILNSNATGTGTTSSTGTGCTSCGQANTCYWLAGSKNKDTKYIFIIMRSDNFREILCNEVHDYWGDGKNTWQSFRKIAQKFANGINYITNKQLVNNDVAVYVSSVVGGSDPNCPAGTVDQIYGFVQNGKGDKASARPGVAYYCFTSGEAKYGRSYDKIFAHEQIGHAFAFLEDEYVNTSVNPNNVTPFSSYNCTADSKCTKWGNKKDVCLKGCRYTNLFRRSSVDSLMRSNSATGFGTLNSYIIEETIKHVTPQDIVPGHPLKENLDIPENTDKTSQVSGNKSQ